MTCRVLLMMAFGLGAILFSVVVPKCLCLVWNTTASIPVGLYMVLSPRPARGQLGGIAPPSSVRRFVTARRYLSPTAALIKTVAAVGGDRVCRWRASVWISGHKVAIAHLVDRRHRPLPVWRGCHVLAPAQVFVLGWAPDSFDSRYFGPIDARSVIGAAFPIWTVLSN